MFGTINEDLCLEIEALPSDIINVLGGIYKMLGDQSHNKHVFRESKHNFLFGALQQYS